MTIFSHIHDKYCTHFGKLVHKFVYKAPSFPQSYPQAVRNSLNYSLVRL